MHTFKNSRQFLDAVRAMRAAQKLYSETKSRDDFLSASKLEFLVDIRLAEIDRVFQEKLAEETRRGEEFKEYVIKTYGEEAYEKANQRKYLKRKVSAGGAS